MLGLFKKKKYNTVVKFFKLVDLDFALNFDNKILITNLLSFIDSLEIGQATNYYITGPYPASGWIKKTSFLKSLEKKHYKNVILLLISGDNFAISFQNWLPNYDNPPEHGTIDFSIEVPNDLINTDVLIDKIRAFASELSFDYGYAFKSSNMLGASEQNVKKNIFGITASILPTERAWNDRVLEIDQGKIKDIYEFSFLSTKYHKNVLNLIPKENELIDFGAYLRIWKVHPDTIDKYRSEFKELLIAPLK